MAVSSGCVGVCNEGGDAQHHGSTCATAGDQKDISTVHGYGKESRGARGHGPILPDGSAADGATVGIFPMLAAEEGDSRKA